MSPRRQAKATHSSPGRWQRNNNSRRHSSLMPTSSFPPAPPTRGWPCRALCPGCQGQRPARCNTRSRTPSAKLYNLKWTAFCKKLRSLQT
uniref:Uncharacterized protein DKFZp459B0754 n=1 Tax=Pongo abelii TaxID=9601 RepID=Q5RDU2_PONAB|nr:hypothetical protein [Pongo abelii]